MSTEGRSDPDAYGVDTEKLRTCPGCGVEPGNRHGDICDVSRCPACGIQAIQCGAHRSAGQSIWTGEWPGEAECKEWGWWTDITLHGKVQTVPDLNRLAIAAARGEIHWDVSSERYHR